jgi:uncharacterized protein (TIGR03435 family)
MAATTAPREATSLPWIRGIVFTMLVPGTIAVYAPLQIAAGLVPAGGFWQLGWLVSGVGALGYVLCFLHFLASGGTPAIFFTRPVRFLIGEEPHRLVQAGLYRVTRNPMYVSVLLVVFGQALRYASWPIAEYGLFVWLSFHIVVVLLEEPHLRDERGAAYDDYCRRVPRWIIRLRAPGFRLQAAAVVVVGALTASTVAQTPSLRPGFEVASVKPNRGDDGPRGISFSPSGRFAWNAMTLKQLMQSAYAELEYKQIVGGPSWIDTDRFDIAATSPDALREIGPDGLPRGLFTRLRTLLEDRFALRTHVEARTLGVYALEAASTPFLPGPDLRKTTVDCEAVIRDAAAGRRVAPGQPSPPCSIRMSHGRLTGQSITMEQMANVLSGPAARPVLDRTGLAGVYDVELKWNEDASPAADAPSFFTAVREQLGLKLEATRASLPVLVIDSASMPTPN